MSSRRTDLPQIARLGTAVREAGEMALWGSEEL